MAASQTNEVIQHLRRTVLLRDGAGLTDGQLLGCFLKHRDDAAFATLVRRHGPMVWGVCRRLLNPHEAEDAFQATFLVLVRKAASIMPRERVANWLYGVAHKVALQARRTAARRGAREKQVTEMPEPVVRERDLWSDLRPLLDQELSRLPDAYREVIILSDLEGKTRCEVARQLGLPEGTVASRLARARALLAKRLSRHGLAVSGGAWAAVVSEQAASACVPTPVESSTIQAASLLAAGHAATTGVISVKVAALAEGVLKTMLLTKLKAALAVLLTLGFMATGTTVLNYHKAAGQSDNPPITAKPMQTTLKGEKLPPGIEGRLKWGKPVNGLRAALAIRYAPAGPKAGGLPDLYLVVQNASKAPLRFSDTTESPERRMLYHKRDGKIILDRLVFDWSTKADVLLQPREVAFLLLFPHDRFPPNPKDGPSVGSVTADVVLKEPRYTLVAHMHISKAPAGAWTGKLVTGETTGAAAEIKSDPPPAAGQKTPAKQEKEGFTAWGKEVGGLRAGLGFRPGQKRAYSPGETVKLVVRVRNLGKEEVKFQYLKEFFIETSPVVTDGKGKPVPLGRQNAGGLVHVPVEVNLAPGKEIELYELKLDPRTETQSVHKWQWNLYGTGTFSVQYERLAHPDIDKILSKLATGKLEVEIKFDPPRGEIEKKSPQKQEQKPEKEGFTAWGKEAGGLRAGLGFRPGEHRAYHHGETVALVVRVRNVGKETVKFEYLKQFLDENPPVVTDADGKTAPPERIAVGGALHVPVKVSLAPGKEIELASRIHGASGVRHELRPAGERENSASGEFRGRPLHGTGKVSVQYERVFGDTSVGKIQLDPALSNLATGRLELEINPAPPAAAEKK